MLYPTYKYVVAVGDVLVILMSYVLAFQIRFPHSRILFELGNVERSLSIFLALILIIAHLFIFQAFNLYKINILLKNFPQFILILKGLAIGTISVIISQFTFKYSSVFESRLLYFYYLTISMLSLSIFRIILFKNIFIYLSNNGFYNWNVAIIGSGKNARLVAADLLTKPIYGTTIKGFISDSHKKDENIFQGHKHLGKISELEAIVKETSIDELIIAEDDLDYEELINLIERCQKTEKAIQVVSDLYGVLLDKLTLEKYSNIPLIRMHGSRHNRKWKIPRRIFDIIFSAFLIILISPILIMLALAIKLTSKGPIFYKQQRIGLKGEEFTFYKFRTMYVGSDKDGLRSEKMKNFINGGENGNEKMTKVVDDRKLTSIGKFLRRSSLDEIPQFYNVLKGDMATVGPRPCLLYEYEHYDLWQRKRNEVLPGITGLWQVSGRSEVAHNEMIVMDLYYIRNASPWFDLLLILKTVGIMINGKGGG